MKKCICWCLSIIELKNARWNIEISKSGFNFGREESRETILQWVYTGKLWGSTLDWTASGLVPLMSLDNDGVKPSIFLALCCLRDDSFSVSGTQCSFSHLWMLGIENLNLPSSAKLYSLSTWRHVPIEPVKLLRLLQATHLWHTRCSVGRCHNTDLG